MSTKALFFMCSLIMVVGCGLSSTDSKDVRTSEINSNITIFSEDEVTTVEVSLIADEEGGSINLSRGDRLTATMRGNTISLPRFGDGWYKGAFAVTPEDDAVIRVSLTRDNRMDANSSVIIPNIYAIETPTQDAIFNTGESITATWSPSEPDKEVVINYRYNCRPEGDETTLLDDYRRFIILNTGTHTTTVTHILDARVPAPIVYGVPCPVQLLIVRSNVGELDSAFGGGEIRATRQKTENFNIIP